MFKCVYRFHYTNSISEIFTFVLGLKFLAKLNHKLKW